MVIRNPNARSGLLTEALDIPKTIKPLATVSSGLPELNIKAPLQRRMHAWAPGL